MKFNILFLCVMSSVAISCSGVDNKKDVDEKRDQETDVSNTPIHYNSPDSLYTKDSLFIVNTVWLFIKKQVSPFHFYTTFNIPLSKVKVEVDTIIYSPNQLKLFSFNIISYWDSKENKSISSGDGFIGYRNNRKERWRLFHFDQFGTGGFHKYNSIRKLFREYYLGDGEFKNDLHNYWISEIKNYKSIPFKYNLDNKLFWDSSIVWQKGIPIPGYYSFEVDDQAKPGEENIIKKLPQLTDADSLINNHTLEY